MRHQIICCFFAGLAAQSKAQTGDPWSNPQIRSREVSKPGHQPPRPQRPRLDESPKKPDWLLPEPRVAFGVGLDVPELFPLEAYFFYNKWLSIRSFYVWPLPYKVRVEMPRDVVSKKGFIVEHPDLNINFQLIYGPQYGWETMVFPFRGRFHLFGGASYRSLRLKGVVQSNLILRAEAGGEPLETNSSVRIEADAATSQYVARAGLGYLYVAPMGLYFNFFAGYSRPYATKSGVEVKAAVVNTRASNQADVNAALEGFKEAKEAEMEATALKQMRPVEKLALPILGLSLGVYF